MEEFAKKYFDLLTNEYAGINLTRINTYDEFYDKQILDSIAPLEQSEKFLGSIGAKDICIDVGFGGGFPLLPLAYKYPEKKFIGVETRGKKAKVVNEIAAKLGLRNVKCIHARIENLYIDKDAFVTFKAVGKVNDFLSKINTDKDVEVYFYKGPGFYELEKDQIEQCSREWKTIEEKEIIVPNTDKRLIIGYKPLLVPRGTKNNSKQLVILSSII